MRQPALGWRTGCGNVPIPRGSGVAALQGRGRSYTEGARGKATSQEVAFIQRAQDKARSLWCSMTCWRDPCADRRRSGAMWGSTHPFFPISRRRSPQTRSRKKRTTTSGESILAYDANQDATNLNLVNVDGIHGGVGGLQSHAVLLLVVPLQGGLVVIEDGHYSLSIAG